MNAGELEQLKLCISRCKSDPSILSDPSLSFVRDYLESLGAKLPPSAYKTESQSKPEVFEEPESEEDPIIESDIEFDCEIVEPDTDPPQKMGDSSVKVSEENREASEKAKTKGIKAISDGNLKEAIEHLTKAILLNPTCANTYATRASVYIKMKKPNAAMRDADFALQINPDLAVAYKSRGIAWSMLGQWEKSAHEFYIASYIDFDEEIPIILEKVERNAQKIAIHRNKYAELREEWKVGKPERERKRRRAEAEVYLPVAYKMAKKEETASSSQRYGLMPGGFLRGMSYEFHGGMPCGFPGGMYPLTMPGGFHGDGMPGGNDYNKILNDTDLMIMEAFEDPEAMAALQDVMKNPVSLRKHQSNPKVVRIIAKLISKFAGPL